MTLAKGISLGAAAHELSLDERIAQLITMVGGRARAAKLVGRSTTTIDNWRSGTPIPLLDALTLAREAQVSLDWVATGYDRRPDLPDVTSSVRGGFTVVRSYHPAEQQVGEVTDAAIMAFGESWLREIGIEPADAALMNAPDDAMAPEIGAGDQVLLDRGVKGIKGGGIYALGRDGGVLIRRVQLMIDGSVQLIPSNPLYLAERLAAEAAKATPVAGQARWVGRVL
jgi:hypothetical protein